MIRTREISIYNFIAFHIPKQKRRQKTREWWMRINKLSCFCVPNSSKQFLLHIRFVSISTDKIKIVLLLKHPSTVFSLLQNCKIQSKCKWIIRSLNELTHFYFNWWETRSFFSIICWDFIFPYLCSSDIACWSRNDTMQCNANVKL